MKLSYKHKYLQNPSIYIQTGIQTTLVSRFAFNVVVPTVVLRIWADNLLVVSNL